MQIKTNRGYRKKMGLERNYLETMIEYNEKVNKEISKRKTNVRLTKIHSKKIKMHLYLLYI